VRRFIAVAIVVASFVLGSTVFRGEVASAASAILQVFVTNDSANPVPVKQQGATDVNVLGSVSTRPNIPTTQFSYALYLTTSAIISGPDPAGTNYAITSFSVANSGSTSATANVASYYGTTADCHTFAGTFDLANGPSPQVPAGDTVSLVFPQPFVLSAKSGAQTCLTVIILAPLEVTIVGYRF
jgi:hypothetical protein